MFTKTENTAKTANFSVEVENQKVKKGETITFHVTVKSSVPMSKLEAYLNYDSTYLEFVTATKDTVVGASGMLSIAEAFEPATMEVDYAIEMKALEVGTTMISIEDIYLEDETNSDIIEIHQTSASIQIEENKKRATDATLSELRVFPGKFNEEFRPNRMKYTIDVDHSVNELILSAIPTKEDSVVTIDQPESLQVGSNEIVITVTAASGSVNKYKITVNRASK